MKKIFGILVVVAMFLPSVSLAQGEFDTTGTADAPNTTANQTGATAGSQNQRPGSNITVQTASTVQTAPKALKSSVKLQNPIRVSTFSELAALVTATAVKILMPFIVLAFIYSGFLFVKAQGNPSGIEEAKNTLWYSMIGAFILLGAWGFAQIIGRTVSTLTQ